MRTLIIGTGLAGLTLAGRLGQKGRTSVPAGAKDRGDYGHSPQARSLRMTVEASARINEALGGWAEWARRPAAPQEAGR